MKSVVLEASRNNINNIKYTNFEDTIRVHLPSSHTLVLEGSLQLKKPENYKFSARQ